MALHKKRKENTDAIRDENSYMIRFEGPQIFVICIATARHQLAKLSRFSFFIDEHPGLPSAELLCKSKGIIYI